MCWQPLPVNTKPSVVQTSPLLAPASAAQVVENSCLGRQAVCASPCAFLPLISFVQGCLLLREHPEAGSAAAQEARAHHHALHRAEDGEVKSCWFQPLQVNTWHSNACHPPFACTLGGFVGTRQQLHWGTSAAAPCQSCGCASLLTKQPINTCRCLYSKGESRHTHCCCCWSCMPHAGGRRLDMQAWRPGV